MTTSPEPHDSLTSPNAPLPPQAQQPPSPYERSGHIVVSQPSAPTTIALWATILTGAVAALGLVSAVTAPGRLDETTAVLADPQNASPFAGQDPLGLLSGPLLIASFVLLALWMSRLRSAMTARGDVVGGPPAVEWWGWFVPLGNFVLPFLGMRGITRGKAGLGIVLGWWITFCLYWVVSFASVFPTFAAIDISTGELTNPSALDATVPITWASALALAASWAFLATVIRQATAAEKAAANATGSVI